MSLRAGGSCGERGVSRSSSPKASRGDGGVGQDGHGVGLEEPKRWMKWMSKMMWMKRRRRMDGEEKFGEKLERPSCVLVQD